MTRVATAPIGATFHVRDEEVTLEERGAIDAGLLSLAPHTRRDPRVFRPLDIVDLRDPNLDGRDQAESYARVDRWIRGDLARALEKEAPLIRVLEVVYPGESVVYTFQGSTVEEDVAHPDWDLRCAVAGTLLDDVIAGRRHWGDLLLGGMLRGASRAYTVDGSGLRRSNEQPLFVYHAISYEESVRRELDRLTSTI